MVQVVEICPHGWQGRFYPIKSISQLLFTWWCKELEHQSPWQWPSSPGRLRPQPLRWRHNWCDGVSNHQPHDCLIGRLCRRQSKKTSKLRVTGLCVGIHRWPVNSPHKCIVTRKMFPFDDVIMPSEGLSDDAVNSVLYWQLRRCHGGECITQIVLAYHFILPSLYIIRPILHSLSHKIRRKALHLVALSQLIIITNFPIIYFNKQFRKEHYRILIGHDFYNANNSVNFWYDTARVVSIWLGYTVA